MATASTPALDPGLASALVAAVGSAHVLVDPELTAGYAADWTGAYRGRAGAVVRPADAEQVRQALLACAAHGVGVVPQGGNTGLVGGSVPWGAAEGAVVLSLRRLDAVSEPDPAAGLVTGQAGATLAAVQRRVRSAGFEVGVDFAARESATLGGIAATNAGGERVLRHGTTRAQVAGLAAVLADGTVVSRLSGLPKDNVSYDLPSLLVGSEGTLGVITAVQLRLLPASPARTTALVAVADVAAAVALVAQLRSSLPSLDAVELLFDEGLDVVCARHDLQRPLAGRHGAYLLIESVGRRDTTDEFAAALAETGLATDAAVGVEAGERDRLWFYREAHTESVNALGVPVKLDVAVPAARIARYVDDVRLAVEAAAPGGRTFVWGHLAECNLHVNVVGPAATDAAARYRVTDAVLRLAAAYGGSVGAEHGVGRAKTAWMGLSRSAGELAATRALKRALDPAGILNPGVLDDRAVVDDRPVLDDRAVLGGSAGTSRPGPTVGPGEVATSGN